MKPGEPSNGGDLNGRGRTVDVETRRRPIETRMAHFRGAVERNKTRRHRDGEPPAALPATVDPRPTGGLSGGAAVAMTFEEEA